jgi:3-hydroxyisobutyrate dehydrogenase-like beta-hydroxyacid dehydrogenase
MTIAVIGLGGMGAGIALSLLRAGFQVAVYNRTASRAEPLREAGARAVRSPAEAVAGARCVLLSLADEAAVEEVVFGQLVGQDALRAGQMVLDTSTVSPEYARAAATRLHEAGLRRVEACVVGNPAMAASGQLRVFAAGDQADVDDVADVFAAIGQEVRYLGPTGQASSVKLALNLLLGIQTLGLAEAVRFAETAGLDRSLFLDVVESSGWRSPVLSFRAGFMRRRGYQPAAFRAELMRKDLVLAAREAAAHDTDLPLLRLAAQRYETVIGAGHGSDDAAVVAELH